MSYTGTWKRTAARFDQAEPLGHPEYAAEHMHPGRDERVGARPPYAAPRRQAQTPPALTDDGRAYDSVLPYDSPPGLVDGEPVQHDDGEPMPRGSGRSYEGNRDAANRIRSIDRNSGRSRLLRPLELDEGRRETERIEVIPSGDAGTVRALRGDNALALNNPAGDGAGGPTRNGFRVRRWYARRIPMHRMRHELRVVRDKLADSARNSPPPAVQNRYTSAFPDVASFRKRTQFAPLARRSPRPWDESAVTDGSDVADYLAGGPALPSWGL